MKAEKKQFTSQFMRREFRSGTDWIGSIFVDFVDRTAWILTADNEDTYEDLKDQNLSSITQWYDGDEAVRDMAKELRREIDLSIIYDQIPWSPDFDEAYLQYLQGYYSNAE